MNYFSNAAVVGFTRCSAGAVALLALTTALYARGGASNNTCNTAADLALGENAFATLEATTGGPAACVPMWYDIWFRFESDFTGPLRISTCNNADFDTVIHVYNGCNCNNLVNLGCSDQTSGCANGTSRMTVPVDAGDCYLIRVGGWNGDSGEGVLTLSVDDAQNAAAADRIVSGSEADDRYGWSVAGNARINTDALRDILVGSYLYDIPATNAGRAYAHRGSSMANLYTLPGALGGDKFGYSVALADVNDDGRDDMLIGAPYHDANGSNSGRVYAYSGFTGALLWTRDGAAAGDRLGIALACAGDVNDDGFLDVIAGAPYSNINGEKSGRIHILSGQDGSQIRSHKGQTAGELFGWSVTSLGDLNADGKDDYAAGAPKHSSVGSTRGRVSLFSGATGGKLKRLNGDANGDRFGTAIAGATFTFGGDVYTLLLVGSPYNDDAGSSAGRIRAYWRNHDNPSCGGIICSKNTINGGNPGDQFGASVAIGDLIGSGFPDFIVGAPRADLNGSSSGAVYILNGVNAAVGGTLYGQAPGDQFGKAVALAGDFNGDSFNDLVVGAPFNDAADENAGRAYVFFTNIGGSRVAGADGAGHSDAAVLVKSVDINADGLIDADDLITTLTSWGACSASGQSCPADLDSNGEVNVEDVIEILNHWD